MKCKNARRALVLDHYGELQPAEKSALEAHLGSCRRCAAERDETERVLSLVEACPPRPAPVPDAERVWSRIESRLDPGRAPEPGRTRPWSVGQWSLAGAALALVLVAGVFIGRSVLPPPAPVESAASRAGSSRSMGANLKPVLAGHLEDLKPLLLDYANYSANSGSDRTVPVDEDFLRVLMFQNVLLRKALAGSDPAAADLLDDCDLILKEIINRDRLTAASPEAIQGLIRDRDVLFKLEIVKKI